MYQTKYLTSTPWYIRDPGMVMVMIITKCFLVALSYSVLSSSSAFIRLW